VNERFDGLTATMNKRFDQVNGRIDSLTASTNQRFDQVNRRIDALWVRSEKPPEPPDSSQN
jgi:DNA anti-recombination protein RmuC